MSIQRFYGDPTVNKKSSSWQLLREFRPPPQTYWLIVGDFNEIILQNENMDGRPRSKNQMNGFHQVIEECNLRVLEHRG